MKISSQSAALDLMSAGVDVSEQTDMSITQNFKSYMQQSASEKSYQNTSEVSTSAKSRTSQSSSVKNSDAKAEESDRDVSKVDKQETDHSVKDTTYTKNDKQSSSENTLQDDLPEEMETDGVQDILATSVISEQFTALLDTVSEQLSELLGIDMNEFEQILSQMDMQITNLFDSGNLRQLLLTTQDAQPVDLLTDEDLAGLLDQMSGLVEEALSTSQISASTLQSAIEQVNALKNVPETDVEDGLMDTAATEIGSDTDNSNIRFTVETDEADEQSYEDGRQDQTDLASLKNQVVTQLNQSVGQLAEASSATETVTPADIVNQVVEQIKLTARQDTTSMELQLYPEHLGKVAIQVTSKNGIVTAQITAENEMARAALEGSIQTLKETLQNQQLKVEAIEVMVSTSSFSEQQFENEQANDGQQANDRQTRRIHLDELEDVQDLTEEEQLNVDMMRQEGRSVDYTA